MAVSATIVEPYWVSPRAAVVNAIGGFGAVISASTQAIQALWVAFAVLLSLIFIAGLTAAVTSAGTLNWAGLQLAKRLGRAAVVGTLALLLIALSDAVAGENNVELLVLGTSALVASISFDWISAFSRVVRRREAATVIAAIGPRMLLTAASRHGFKVGDRVIVETPAGKTPGSIVARLPHPDGLRYRIALAEEWTSILRTFPQDVILETATADAELVGSVGPGTTERTLEFEPLGSLEVGGPVRIGVDGRTLLYQVSRLRLDSSDWAGAHAVVPHASGHLVGWPEGAYVRGGTHLPDAHHLIYRADNLSGSLEQSYYEIGRIKGTDVPIGLRMDSARRGHIAILGMSGMGKTGVAQRICRTLGGDHVVVALDATGEYENHLNFPSWTADDFDTNGYFVHQPGGDPPDRAATFIEKAMEAGRAEYVAGQTPSPRVILLEEAHTFLPEWNVALRAQQDRVAYSTRMIMQSRKFGITFMIVSQRTAVVSKSALSQCENYVILKTLDQTGLEYLESLVGPEMRQAIPSLQRFEALCVGPAFNTDEAVIVTLSPP